MARLRHALAFALAEIKSLQFRLALAEKQMSGIPVNNGKIQT